MLKTSVNLKGEILKFFPLIKLMKTIKHSKKYIELIKYKEIFDCYLLSENLSQDDKYNKL